MPLLRALLVICLVSCALGDTTQAPTATTSANPFAPFPEETDRSKNDFEEHSNSDGGADGFPSPFLPNPRSSAGSSGALSESAPFVLIAASCFVVLLLIVAVALRVTSTVHGSFGNTTEVKDIVNTDEWTRGVALSTLQNFCKLKQEPGARFERARAAALYLYREAILAEFGVADVRLMKTLLLDESFPDEENVDPTLSPASATDATVLHVQETCLDSAASAPTCPVCHEALDPNKVAESGNRHCMSCYKAIWIAVKKWKKVNDARGAQCFLTGDKTADLAFFRKELSLLPRKRRCKMERSGGMCDPALYSHTTAANKKCTRCRLLSCVDNFPDLVYRLLDDDKKRKSGRSVSPECERARPRNTKRRRNTVRSPPETVGMHPQAQPMPVPVPLAYPMQMIGSHEPQQPLQYQQLLQQQAQSQPQAPLQFQMHSSFPLEQRLPELTSTTDMLESISRSVDLSRVTLPSSPPMDSEYSPYSHGSISSPEQQNAERRQEPSGQQATTYIDFGHPTSDESSPGSDLLDTDVPMNTGGDLPIVTTADLATVLPSQDYAGEWA